jgi:hypothetical protein
MRHTKRSRESGKFLPRHDAEVQHFADGYSGARNPNADQDPADLPVVEPRAPSPVAGWKGVKTR